MRYFFVLMMFFLIGVNDRAYSLPDYIRSFNVIDGEIRIGGEAYINSIRGGVTYGGVMVWSDEKMAVAVLVRPVCEIEHGTKVRLIDRIELPEEKPYVYEKKRSFTPVKYVIWLKFTSDSGCEGWLPLDSFSERKLPRTAKYDFKPFQHYSR